MKPKDDTEALKSELRYMMAQEAIDRGVTCGVCHTPLSLSNTSPGRLAARVYLCRHCSAEQKRAQRQRDLERRLQKLREAKRGMTPFMAVTA